MEDGRRVTDYSFEEFPEDVQLSIVSFLTPEEAGNFSCTSKRFSELYRDGRSRLWRSLCDRRWGHVTTISVWGQGNVSYKLLYRILHGWEKLLGFWRPCGSNAQRSFGPYSQQAKPPTLVFFEWGPWFLSGSRVYPVEDGTHHVVKKPFLWMWITSDGQVRSYLNLDGNIDEQLDLRISNFDLDLIPVNVNLIGCTHLKVEVDSVFGYGMSHGEDSGSNYDEEYGNNRRCPEETREIYEYYANRRCSNGFRRQRKKDQGRQERIRRQRQWETEHFIKIVDSSPTPDRPLQGLWKGVSEDRKLEFYLVTYDGLGLSCRRIADLSERLASCKPVFWTAHPTLFEGPLQPEDALIYDSRIHLQPLSAQCYQTKPSTVTHFMLINSSYDLVLSGLTELFKNPWRVEGRIWQYKNGTFGFGFLRDNFIVDLMHVSNNGHLLDVAEL